MDEYISREKAIETIQYRVCQGHGNKEHICERGSCAYCGIMEVMSDISSIEAADVQPVVYCKDCKYAQNPNDTMVYCTYFECGTMSQNDFCSQGEKP